MCRENDDIGNSTFQSKEPQHFNRWPMMSTEEYLHAWHSGVVGAMMSASAGDRILLDASPQYLMTAAAPVRIKAVAPHALFVLVIRVCLQLLVVFCFLGSLPWSTESCTADKLCVNRQVYKWSLCFEYRTGCKSSIGHC